MYPVGAAIRRTWEAIKQEWPTTRRRLVVAVLFCAVAVPFSMCTSAMNREQAALRESLAEPSSPPRPLVRWQVVGVECGDGWQSGSIGKSGACSWHGGVVTIYSGSDGSTLRCGTGMHPPRDEYAQALQFDMAGHLFCTDVGP